MEKLEYFKALKKLHKYNTHYYVKNKPLVSDRVYDLLMVKVKAYEDKMGISSDITSKPGSDLSTGFMKFAHRQPMLSLANAYSHKEVMSFIDKILKVLKEPVEIFFEDKVDGLALSLIYVEGSLNKAVTRGDGVEGDLVTENASFISSIPKYIEGFNGEIRGEVYISPEDFKKFNINHDYANPRNLAAGTLKTQSSNVGSIIKERNLDFRAYYYHNHHDDVIPDYREQLDILRYFRFKVPLKTVSYSTYELNPKRVLNILQQGLEGIADKPYPIDGMVVKVSSAKARDVLGSSTKAPKWAIAYKYPSEQTSTTLIDVEFSVGRTGTVSPVAIFKPVTLAGTTVRRALLHNRAFIKNLNIGIGDTIAVEKGGEIIPKVMAVLESKSKVKLDYPDKCPVCNSDLIFESDTLIYCPDSFGTCNQFIEQLSHFASRDALNINSLGEKVCKKICEELKVTNLLELLDLSMEDLRKLEGFRDKSAFKLYKALKKCYNQPMEKWLFALGIPSVGKVNAVRICKELKTWNRISKATEEDFTKIHNIGNSVSAEVVEWFSQEKNRELVKGLKKRGMPRRYEQSNITTSTLLEGKKIVITGSFGEYSRDFLANKIEMLGGEYHSSVKKDSTTLLCGDNTGKKKSEEAKKKGLEVLNVTETLVLLQLN